MTNSKVTLANLHHLASISGKNDKIAFLREKLTTDELFKMVIVQALDPMITYGVKDVAFLEDALNKALFEEEDRERRTLSADTYEVSSFLRVLRSLEHRKSTGANAHAAIKGVGYDYDAETIELLIMILSKDIRAGCSVSSVNKAVPGTVFEFNVMLAAKYEPEKIVYPCRVEPKYDGMRLLAIGDQVGFEFYTRTGKVVDTISSMVKQSLADLYTVGLDEWQPKSRMVFDGELMGKSFADTMRKARKKDSVYEDGVFYVFDALPIEEFQVLKAKKKKTLPYNKRRKALADSYRTFCESYDSVGLVLPPSYVCTNADELMKFYLSFRDRGLEGAIIKNPDGAYHPRRNRDWMKLKDSGSVDVPIVGAVEGTGKYQDMLGALVVDVEGVQVNVGTGFHDGERKELWEAHNEGWLLDRIIEVEFHEKTPDGSLRHPRFKCFRDDKSKECGIGV